jgi:hypothetical protein
LSRPTAARRLSFDFFFGTRRFFGELSCFVERLAMGLAVVELPEAEGVAKMRRIVGMFVDVDVVGVEVVVTVGRDKPQAEVDNLLYAFRIVEK